MRLKKRPCEDVPEWSDLPQTKQPLVPPEAQRFKEGFSPGAFGRSGCPADTLISAFWPPDLETMNSCCFKPAIYSNHRELRQASAAL